jgi:hypothetical protein
MRRLLIALLATVVLGCGGDSDAVPTLPATSADVAGDFILRSANGTPLPFIAFTTTVGDAWELASDKMFVKSDGTWSESTLYIVHKLSDGTQNSNETVVSGTYVIANGQINFAMKQGGTDTFAGSVIGTELRLLYNGRLFVYTK